MRRFTVMGFTEAELGFVVAALFSAIAVATLNDRDAQASGGDVVREQLARTIAELDHTKAELQATKADLERANEELARRKNEEDKRSTKVPQCWEKGRQREAIGEIVVLGENSYGIEGKVAGIDEILNRFAASIADGQTLGCRYVLRAMPSSDVNAVEHSKAVTLLRRYFDVDDRSR